MRGVCIVIVGVVVCAIPSLDASSCPVQHPVTMSVSLQQAE
jgi:hypothetical protein